MSARRYATIVAVLLILTVVRIANTHLTFSQTLDEPVHVAAGHEWLTKGSYHLDFQHPPQPRMLFAYPFRSVVPANPAHPSEYGNDLYAKDGRYIHNVATTRRGNLVYVVIACLALAACARKLFGETVACVALLLFVTLPPVLAHGGLATTDMAVVAGFALALYALLMFVEQPTIIRSIALGFALAFGVCTKYSFVVFFPPVMLAVLIVRKRFVPSRLLIALLTAFVVTWGAFGFRVSTLAEANPRAADLTVAAGLSERWTQIPLPAPDLVMGFITVKFHDRVGHDAFLLGETSNSGWWQYFPIALGVKTPIPFLLLALAGIALAIQRKHRNGWILIASAAAILIISMTSRINIGVRHILAIYVPLSILGAYAAVEFSRLHRNAHFAVAALLLWLGVTTTRAHPDYLPWMNAFAGERPQHVLLDSNFDWGQDLWRLGRICKQRHVTELGYALATTIRPDSIGITGGHLLSEETPSKGWLVLSEQSLELARVKNPNAFVWLEKTGPYERVGTTLRLYHVD